MGESNDNSLIGFIASNVETMRHDTTTMRKQMATKEDLARLEGQLTERLDASTTGIRGDIEQVHLRLNGIEHSILNRWKVN